MTGTNGSITGLTGTDTVLTGLTAWRNRIVESRIVSAGELRHNPSNFRRHPDAQVAALRGLLNQVGIVAPLIAYHSERAGGALTLIDGEARDTLGGAWPCDILDVNDTEADLILSVFDRISGEATIDPQALMALLGRIEMTAMEDDGLLALLGQMGTEASKALPREAVDAEPQVDRASELQQLWGTATGQVWACGEHRLICGDCTDAGVVARVMDGESINVAVTSPPYASQRKYDESSTFRPIAPNEYVDWFDGVQSNVAAHLAIDGSWFVNIKEHCEDGQRHLYVKDLAIAHARRWAWLLVDEFCWLRSGYPGGWDNRFKNGFEPVYHFSKHIDIKFRPQGVSVPGITKEYDGKDTRGVSGMSNRSGGVGHKVEGLIRPSNVLDYKEPVHGGEHAAPFPVSLPSFFINAFSDDGDIVYDPFLGSGTTIIACEQLGRKCRAVEISPGYVAVALQRYQDATATTPHLLED